MTSDARNRPLNATGPLPVVAGAGTVMLLDGTTLCLSTRTGDVTPGGALGLFVRDTRVLSRWELTVDGHGVEELSVHELGAFAARFIARRPPTEPADSAGSLQDPPHGRNSTSQDPPRRCGTLLLVRERLVADGLRETVTVENTGLEATVATLALHVDSDFADLFAVKAGRPDGGGAEATVTGPELVLRSRADGSRGLRLSATADLQTTPDGLCWRVDLPPRTRWSTEIVARPFVDGRDLAPRFRRGEPIARTAPARELAAWHACSTTIFADDPRLAATLRRSVADLGALRIEDPAHRGRAYVAAGAPWFLTLFGRDSLLTAWMALPLDVDLAVGTLQTLAAVQGRRTDPATEEEPGRILHELRRGPDRGHALAGLGEPASHSDRHLGEPASHSDELLSWPASQDDQHLGELASHSDEHIGELASRSDQPYYGTVDATPLFVMLLGEAWRWGADEQAVRALLPAADAALEWLRKDGDGFVRYRRATDHGLVNQGWKDSVDGVNDARGRPGEPPLALAEVQGYAYAAWCARAELAAAFGDQVTAGTCRRRAAALRRRFNERFWLAEKGWYAVALDRHERPLDALTSNPGHCLWTGIVDDAYAAALVAHLGSADLDSGYGIRTLAAGMGAYDPMSYHNGSVWPHDTALCVAGLLRYPHIPGAVELAHRLTDGLLDAAEAFGGRLPELYCGFPRDQHAPPVPYPTSCSPQAWASAAPLLLVRALLGLDPHVPQRRVTLRPRLPARWGTVRLDGQRLGPTRRHVCARGEWAEVTGPPPGWSAPGSGP